MRAYKKTDVLNVFSGVATFLDRRVGDLGESYLVDLKADEVESDLTLLESTLANLRNYAFELSEDTIRPVTYIYGKPE